MDTIASATESTTLLKLSSVSVAFGGLLALGGIDLDVAQGERLAILGPERCRQDHVVQRRRRRHPADLRLGPDQGRRLHAAALASPAEPRRRPHLPANAAVPRPHGRGQSVPRRRRQARSPSIAPANVRRRAVAEQAPRRGSSRLARRASRVERRRSLPRRATPTRGRNGGGHRPRPDDARRAGVRAVARRTRATGRSARVAGGRRDVAAHRTRHGRGPAGRSTESS